MNYCSTRGGSVVTSAEAIVRGIAPDGGLYVPESLPRLTYHQITALSRLSYPERAAKIMSVLLPDFSLNELTDMAKKAYSRFEGEPAPVTVLRGIAVLELYHGPTLAFKDMALQMLPYLMRSAAEKTGEKRQIAILTATSGDTGKAALEGFSDVEGTSVTVFYPLGGVSPIQEKQMVTSSGKNTCVIAVRGNFDDAQTGVKKLFGDPDFIAEMSKRGKVMSSANSINLGRLVPQVAYYFSACVDLISQGIVDADHPVTVCVPTGNFGNILAAWYARRMGAPIGKLICASNSNDVLTRFIATGTYDRRLPFLKTYSPSMDILISSNLERFLWELGGTEETCRWMKELKETGCYSLSESQKAFLRSRFIGGCATDPETLEEIRQIREQFRYVMDPHSAVASRVLRQVRGDDMTYPCLMVSTASPYKFTEAVCKALDIQYTPAGDAFAAAEALERTTGMPVPAAMRMLKDAPVRHHRIADQNEMGKAILKWMDGEE